MGVRGLTTFIEKRSRQYLQSYELHDTYVVLDGNSIASQLYKWHCKCNDCFGGDYDKYAHVVHNFFEILSDCSIIPLIVFDGAYEKRKLITVYTRMKNKLSSAKDLNSATEGRISMFPLFLREIFVDIVLKLGIKCVRCDFEGDSAVAYLARQLKCPLLSYDSDFFIFDVIYIPFSTVDLHVRKKKNVSYIQCEVYRVDKFLNSFGGLDKVNLPLLAIMLGNDYIKKKVFKKFYQQLKIYKSKENEQQRLIKSVIIWLKSETPDSALRKILSRYKEKKRRFLTYKIRKAIQGYHCSEPEIFTYFDITVKEQTEPVIQVPNPDEIEDATEESEDESPTTSEEELTEEEEEEVNDIKRKPSRLDLLPPFFRENFRKCLYPSCFMDMIVANTYYCIPQVEDCSQNHSHTISLEILRVIHKILTQPKKRKLICVARIGALHIKKYFLPIYENTVPTLEEIEGMHKAATREAFFKILNLNSGEICDVLDYFPSSWHLFLISIKYWVINSDTKVELPYIYSLILCAIILNYVDKNVGFYRSTKSFLSKFGTSKPDNSTKPPHCIKENLLESLNDIDRMNSISCQCKMIHYFQMEMKMAHNIRLFERNIVHQFAQFQSCLLHIKYLNSLLKFPFTTFEVAYFFDGTFLYNMTANLLKRTNLSSYLQVLFENCPLVFDCLEMAVGHIQENISNNIALHNPPKKRKKKKKAKETPQLDPDNNNSDVLSEDEFVDENNIYSLLSMTNK